MDTDTLDTLDPTIEIDGFSIKIAPLPAFAGMRMAARLAGMIGPALGQLTALAGLREKKLGEVNVDRLASIVGPAIEALTARLTPEELEATSRALLKGATISHEGGQSRDLLAVAEALLKGRSDVLLGATIHAAHLLLRPYFSTRGGVAAVLAPLIRSRSAASTTSPTNGPSGP